MLQDLDKAIQLLEKAQSGSDDDFIACLDIQLESLARQKKQLSQASSYSGMMNIRFE